MGAFKQRIKKQLRSLFGYDIEKIGKKSFALVNQKYRGNAWVSYKAQIMSILDKLEIDLVLDVGANKGQFARKIRSFYSGDIYSFEPVSSIFEQLAAAAASDPKWHVYNYALGSEESTQTINISDATVFSSLLKTNDYCATHFGAESLGIKEETISVRRLDEVLDAIVPGIESKRIFVKMDTQGYDSEVFNGLGNKLKHVIALQSEVSLIPIYEGMSHWTESISTYESHGFGVAGMFPVNRDAWRVIEYDCLMIKVES